MSDPISEIFQPIYGKPCWQVKQGYGSFLTLEFGDPYLDIQEPRQSYERATNKVRKILARRRVFVHGNWHLWIYLSDWRIFLKDQELANCASNRQTIKKAIIELDGQILIKVTVDDVLRTVFLFDLGGRIEVFPNYADYEKTVDLWLLYQPSGCVFALRADGYYHLAPGNTPPKDIEWMRLEG
jgi:hypothetical protein